MISRNRIHSEEVNLYVESMLKHMRKPLPVARHIARNEGRNTVKFNLLSGLNRPVPNKRQNEMTR